MSKPATARPSMQALLSAELQRELAITRRLLKRVPTDQFDWQPHPKSMKLGTLASHMANLINLLHLSLGGPETDMAAVSFPPSPTETEEVLRRFDANAANIHQALASLDETAFLHEPWTMRRNEQAILTLPRVALTRTLVLNHLIHHRGQLSVYLRLLDIPVPAIYGGSADEAPQR
ncbi:MAG: hypothetical protein NVSMB30_25580 [Hymenobacter sp.]